MNRRSGGRVVGGMVLVLASCARASPPVVVAPPPPPPTPAMVLPEPRALRADLTAFSDDSMRGRSALTADGVRAARFIAARLAAAGVEPAGDSGFLQRVPLQRQRIGPETRFVVTMAGGSIDLPLGRAVVPVPTLGGGMPRPRLSGEGDIVFAGYALSDPRTGHDDLAKLDLAGKTAVFVLDAPPGTNPALRDSLNRADVLGQRLAAVAQRGPAVIVALFTGAMAGQVPLLADELDDGAVTVADTGADTTRALPMVLFGVARAGSPLLPPGWPRDDHPQALRGRRFHGRLDLDVTAIPAYNVVGIVRGSDSTMSRSYVALGAHLDHIGILAEQHGDSIANGADDDGSGTVALLAIARTLTTARHRPRRSTLFVWHTGEELGLYGSAWFTDHPTVPLDSIVAQLNADMIGRNGPDSLYLVGPAAAPNGQSAVLGAIIDSVNAASARPFEINREWDTPTHPEQIYYRSDHFNYARHGIPIVFFTSGLHADYHQVSDDVSKIDFDKLARVATLILQSDLAVANRSTRPLPAGAQHAPTPSAQHAPAPTPTRRTRAVRATRISTGTVARPKASRACQHSSRTSAGRYCSPPDRSSADEEHVVLCR